MEVDYIVEEDDSAEEVSSDELNESFDSEEEADDVPMMVEPPIG